MSKFIDLTGERFGRFIVIKQIDKYKWLCQCDCGIERIVLEYHLKSGHTKSCGCSRIKHGYSKNKIYYIWQSMIQRCTNPNHEAYSQYGSRGITICGWWMKFLNFLNDMGESPGSGYSLERINNNKGYYKENCCWATKEEQQRNRRNNVLRTYNGKTQCLAAWAEEVGISKDIIQKRFKRGWLTERALTTPVKTRKKKD